MVSNHPIPRRPSISRPAACLICAAFCLFLMPSLAQAVCGDYIHIGNPSAEALANQKLHASHPSDPLAPAAPCRGPQCGKAPTAPATPIQTIVPTTHADPILLLINTFRLTHDFSLRALAEDFSLHSEDHTTTPKPPPRSF